MKTRSLLLKPHWNYKEIMSYCDVKTTKAYEIMAICRKRYGGTIKDLPQYVKRDSVLAFLGTTAEREIEIINLSATKR